MYPEYPKYLTVTNDLITQFPKRKEVIGTYLCGSVVRK
jgi:hypothetical protein